MTDLKIKVSEALKVAALNETAKNYLLNNPILFDLLLKAAKRYIGGENLVDAIHTVKNVNANGIATTIDYMGESVTTENEAKEVTQEFLKVIHKVKTENLKSTISLDLSHIGVTIDTKLAFNNLQILAEATKGTKTEVIISAEGTDRADEILETFCKISPDYPNIGITLQAYLYRTPKDLERLLKETNGKIRIVKGAFATPEGYSMGRGDTLDNRYIWLVETLLLNNRVCSIATHHDKIQSKIKDLINEHKIAKTNYEFEMLYGIREDLLKNLQQEGYPCRQYIVYGKEWYLYLCNRIAENPDNLFQAIVDIVE